MTFEAAAPLLQDVELPPATARTVLDERLENVALLLDRRAGRYGVDQNPDRVTSVLWRQFTLGHLG